jgi:RNA polymerase sigma-70 factor, ECF subfamily
VRAVKYFDGFHRQNAKAWLPRIVRNSCYSWIKDRMKTKSLTEDKEGDLDPEHERAIEAAGHGFPAPDAGLLEDGDRRLLNEGLQALPTDYREILVLRELEQLSYNDIGEVVGTPIGTVMSRLSRAGALLRQRLSRDLAAE